MSNSDTSQVEIEPELLFVSILRGGPDPYAGYRRLREQAPVLRTRTGDLVLTRYADCDSALRDRRLGKGSEPGRPSPVDPAGTKAAAWHLHNMLFADPPIHTRLRRQVHACLTARDVAALRDTITASAADLVRRFVAAGGGDFIDQVAAPLPLEVIEDLLGVPAADRALVTPLAQDLAALLRPFAEDALLEQAYSSRDQLVEYFERLVAVKRRSPERDLLSRLAGASGEDALTTDETVASAILLFAAGFETTTSLLGNGILALLANPGQLETLRARPELMTGAVAEMLRYDPPAQLNRRVVLEPFEFLGNSMSTGQFVITAVAAANRDPARFSDPERFHVGRDEGGNLSFSAGPHFCLGGPIAQLQAEAVFDTLLATARFSLDGEVVQRQGLDLHGPLRLPLSATQLG